MRRRPPSAMAILVVAVLALTVMHPATAMARDPDPTPKPGGTTDGTEKPPIETRGTTRSQEQLAAGDCQRYAPNSAAICSDGPLTRIEITTDLNCAVNHVGDIDDEFFGDTACATLIAVGGTLYGPASIPAP